MKSVGTITFHWATNFGAVLQAYALQKTLKELGYNTEIINYIPKRVILLQTMQRVKNIDFISIKKERSLKQFRKEYLQVSTKYSTHDELSKCKNQYDVVICGSDQVWNPGFTLKGEGTTTLSYFLDFVSESTRRIAYAVSFGTDTVSDEYVEKTKEQIAKFYRISVRENTGINILRELGCSGDIVCDPTVLLNKQAYEKLIKKQHLKEKGVFVYLLHKDQIGGELIAKRVCAIFKMDYIDKCSDMNEWLYRLATSKLVVTNSFHGIMLSIIFNTPFIAIPVSGSKMNNRIETILKKIGLEDRLISTYDERIIMKILQKPVNWDYVNNKLQTMRDIGIRFILESIEGI